VEQAKQIGNEEDYQDRPQTHAGPAARAPSAMAVISTSTAQQQQQNNDYDQHGFLPLSI
jgi:hypothetical protein